MSERRSSVGIWALRINHNYDNHLVVAFFDQTRSAESKLDRPSFVFLASRLFQLQNDEVEEVELPAFDFQHQTLFCANVHSNQYLQVESSRPLASSNGFGPTRRSPRILSV